MKQQKRNAAKQTTVRSAGRRSASLLLKSVFTKTNIIRFLICAVLLSIIIAVMVALNLPGENAVQTSARKQQYAPARVTAVLYDDAEPDQYRWEGRRLGRQELEILITQGRHKGETLQLTNYMSALGNVDAKVGTRIIVRMAYNDDGTYYPVMHNYDRGRVLAAVILVFMLFLAVIGGKKGIMTLLGILFTLACIWFVLVPLIIRGFAPIPCAIVIIALTSSASLILLDGFSRKALSAILGSVAGASVAGISAAIVGHLAPLNGFHMGEAEDLILRATTQQMTVSGLLVCGILIASLGAVMDVAMSIASAIHELHDVNPELPARRLFKSGMNIGRDALGATANTLILALAGASLNVLILARLLDIPFIQLINSDFIVIEILQGLVGTFGIILTVPFVALFASQIMSHKARGMLPPRTNGPNGVQ